MSVLTGHPDAEARMDMLKSHLVSTGNKDSKTTAKADTEKRDLSAKPEAHRQ